MSTQIIEKAKADKLKQIEKEKRKDARDKKLLVKPKN